MSKEEISKMKTCVLDIHCVCEGCKRKVKLLLQKVDGVYTVTIDANQGRVQVSGTFEPENLTKKLEKSGKHAEILEVQNSSNRIKNNTTQIEKIQIGNSKMGKGHKSENSETHQKLKGAKVLISPSMENKTVKKIDVDLICSDEGDDNGGVDDDKLRNKRIPMKGKGLKQKGLELIDLESEKSGKTRGEGENGGSKKGKNGGLFGLGKLLGFVKNGGRKGFKSSSNKGHEHHRKLAKKVAAKKDESFELDSLESDFHGLDIKESGSDNSSGVRKIKNKGPIVGLPVEQDLPNQATMNSGYMDSYNRQNIPMMINQQRADVYYPQVYSRSYPSAYQEIPARALSPPARQSESYAHYFSDENADGCNIM